MRNVWRYLKYCGIAETGVLIVAVIVTARILRAPVTISALPSLFVTGVVMCVAVYAQNRTRVRHGQRMEDLPLFGTYLIRDEFSTGVGRKGLPRSGIESMLRRVPDDFSFGKFNNEYVCRKGEGNVLISGGTGSGKSAGYYYTWILLSAYLWVHSLIYDPKGEFSAKTALKGDLIIDFYDEAELGVDPFWMLSEESTDEEIYEACQLIAMSIIPIESGDSHFWTSAAQNLFLSEMVFLWKQRHVRTLTDMIKEILAKPIAEMVMAIEEECSDDVPRMGIIDMVGMDPKVLNSIYANEKNKLFPLIVSPSMAQSFGGRSRKFRPDMLLRGNVYFRIPIDRMDQIAPAIVLVQNLVLKWILSLPEAYEEPDRPEICICMDETVALLASLGPGAADSCRMLCQALRLARSKNAFVVISAQSLAGLRSVVGSDSVANDIIENCRYKVVLEAASNTDTDQIIEWAGKYYQRQYSWSNGRRGNGSITSYTEKDAMLAAELLTLAGTGDALLVSSECGAVRIKKHMYYNDPYYKGLMDERTHEKQMQDA